MPARIVAGKWTTHTGIAHDLNLPTSNVIHQLAFDHISDSIPLLLNGVGKCADLPDVVAPVRGTKSSCGIHYYSRQYCIRRIGPNAELVFSSWIGRKLHHIRRLNWRNCCCFEGNLLSILEVNRLYCLAFTVAAFVEGKRF